MIEASGLTKRYGDRLAVDDLSFHVRPGQVTGFLGPNGAGKSTTMRLRLDLDRGGGRTTFDGKPFRQLADPVREVGALLEAKSFHLTRTARNHLRMLAAPSRIPDRRVDEVLDLVGLGSVARKAPKGFSLGMGQRLGLAPALLGEPRVLLLDEPANGLDPRGITWLRGFLQAYAVAGRTVLVSSHLLAKMAQMADHLVVIGRGLLITEVATREFVAGSSLTAVTVRSPQADKLAEVLSGQHGATVTREPDGTLAVTGIEQARVGELAFDAGLVLHELATRVATLGGGLPRGHLGRAGVPGAAGRAAVRGALAQEWGPAADDGLELGAERLLDRRHRPRGGRAHPDRRAPVAQPGPAAGRRCPATSRRSRRCCWPPPSSHRC